MNCTFFVSTSGVLTKAAAGDARTYASPSSESALLALLERAAPADALAETFCATPRLFGEALLLGDGLEGASEGDLLVLLAGLEPSSSEESPPAKARSSASKSAIVR